MLVMMISIVAVLCLPDNANVTAKLMKKLHSWPNWLKYPTLNLNFNFHHDEYIYAIEMLQKSVSSKKLIPWLSKGNCYFLQTSLLSRPNYRLFVKLYQCKSTFIGWDAYYPPLLM